MKREFNRRSNNNNNNLSNSVGGDGHVMVDRAFIHRGYDNLAFDSTNLDMGLDGGCTTSAHVLMQAHGGDENQDGADDGGRMKRSLSSTSQLRLQRSTSLYGGSLPSHGQEFINPASPSLRNQLAIFYAGSSRSEFDGSSFSGAFTFPVRSQSELSLTLLLRASGYDGFESNLERMFGHKPRSLMYLDEDDYLARPPPSRPVSMGYVNVNQELQAKSGAGTAYPNRYHRCVRLRKANSLEVLNVRELSEAMLTDLAVNRFAYRNHTQNQMMGEVVEGKEIEDVVL